MYVRARFAPRTRSRRRMPPSPPHAILTELRSPGAVLFSLLLFFQFGNEWAVAGWLPLFLSQRLGISPATSLLMLALYWFALLIGRVVAQWIMPRVKHGRILLVRACWRAMFGCVILLATDNRFGAMIGVLLLGRRFRADLSAGGREDRPPVSVLSSGILQRPFFLRDRRRNAGAVHAGLFRVAVGHPGGDGIAAGGLGGGVSAADADLAGGQAQRVVGEMTFIWGRRPDRPPFRFTRATQRQATRSPAPLHSAQKRRIGPVPVALRMLVDVHRIHVPLNHRLRPSAAQVNREANQRERDKCHPGES